MHLVPVAAGKSLSVAVAAVIKKVITLTQALRLYDVCVPNVYLLYSFLCGIKRKYLLPQNRVALIQLSLYACGYHYFSR